MKTLNYLPLLALAAFSCSQAPPPPPPPVDVVEKEAPVPPKKLVAEANLAPKSESEMSGKVVFVELDGMVTMEARMDNVSQGMHAIHIHAEGDCSSADGKSAGGHWNPTGEEHGKWGVAPFHRGDIGNFEADKNGVGSISITTDLWCIGCEDETKNILGKAIIVHAGEDDCKSQPSGAAGARIACGVIEEI